MTTGTVKFFNVDKGYGFIAPNDGGTDAFVHISAVERAGMRTLEKDQRVSYESTPHLSLHAKLTLLEAENV